MTSAYTSLPKLAVRDNMDDEDLTDIDDEVFIRDGRNGSLKLDDDGGVKRPLMAPRRKCKKTTFDSPGCSWKTLALPLCYGLMALVVLLGLIALCIITANIFPMPISMLKSWLTQEQKIVVNESEIIPCTSLASKVVWTRSLPKLTSEAPLRSNDVNGDHVEDIIIGFSTGLDTMDTSDYICALYFENQIPCMGGALALDGRTGETIWTHWTAHAIFSIDCGLDLTDDKIKDCVISGRGGILHAINGQDGTSIWEVPIQALPETDQAKILDVYDAKFIADTDGDGTGDVIASHSTQYGNSRSSEIIILSGKNGNVIRNMNLSNKEQLFIAPQTLVHPDGENIFVLVTSSQRQAGGLYIVPQVNFLYGDLKLRKLHHDTGKGVLLPPILADITSDGTQDIIAAMFNSTIMAYDGITFNPIWNYTVPNSEVISIPIPGYYNDDDVPDFMVKHQIGSGFPIYYYTVTNVIDGRTGKPLLEKPMEDSSSKQMSGLSVTVEGFGNDWFLHWSADCLKYEGAKEKYQFLKGQSLISQTRADLCKLRFNSSLVTNLFALSQHVGPPGISLYSSEDWKSLEFNNSADLKKEPEKYLEKYSGYETVNGYGDLPAVSEKSPKLQKEPRKPSIFRHKTTGILTDLNDKLSDVAYEDAENYKIRNKPIEINLDDDVGDFNVYDDLYDGDNNNADNDRNTMYSRANEIRAQRSQTNNIEKEKMINDKPDFDTVYNNNENIHARILKNYSNAFKDYGEQLGNVLLEKINKDNINKVEKREINNSNKKINKQFQSTNPSPTRVSQPRKIVKKELKNNYFTNTRVEDDDNARIKQIFLKESRRNQDNPILKNKLNIEDFGKVKLRKKRIKRKEHTENDWTNKNDGVQRQPPTGLLLPSLTKTEGKTSIDLVFSTFWLPPSDISVILLQEDLDCISRKKALLENTIRYKENDDIISECLSERGINYKQYQQKKERENVKIALGQVTVYRMKLECVCPEDMLPHQTCRNISTRQSWPEHLGSLGNGYFEPMRKSYT